jgi:hypothetical protein
MSSTRTVVEARDVASGLRPEAGRSRAYEFFRRGFTVFQIQSPASEKLAGLIGFAIRRDRRSGREPQPIVADDPPQLACDAVEHRAFLIHALAANIDPGDASNLLAVIL